MSHKLNASLRPFALALLIVIPIAGVARGDDSFPPPYRGTPLGVEGHWHVGDGTTFNPVNVHIYNRPIPDPNESISPIPPTIVPNGPIYDMTFPNWIDQQPLKIGRVQLYWVSSDPTVFPVMNPSLFPGTGVTGIKGTGTDPGIIVGQGSIAGSIPGYYFDFQIMPNPDYEFIDWIFMSGATGGPTTVQLQQVDVDTVSIPEPASLILLCAAGLLILRRRRHAA